MAKVTVAGKAVHPLLNLPLAALTLAGLSDAVAMVTGRRSWFQLGHNLSLFGVAGAVVGGLPALIDYQGLPGNGEVKREATLHAVIGAAVAGAGLLNLVLRRKQPDNPPALAKGVSLLSIPLLLYASLQGGALTSKYRLDVPQEERAR